MNDWHIVLYRETNHYTNHEPVESSQYHYTLLLLKSTSVLSYCELLFVSAWSVRLRFSIQKILTTGVIFQIYTDSGWLHPIIWIIGASGSVLLHLCLLPHPPSYPLPLPPPTPLQPYMDFDLLQQTIPGFYLWWVGFSFSVLGSVKYLSLHLNLFFGCPLVLTPIWFQSVIWTSFVSSNLLRCPHHLIVCDFIYLSIYSLFVSFCSSVLFLIIYPSVGLIGPNIILNFCLSKTNKLYVTYIDSVQVSCV